MAAFTLRCPFSLLLPLAALTAAASDADGSNCWNLPAEDKDDLRQTEFPTFDGSKKERCENGNILDDGYEYIYNEGMGTDDAACGKHMDGWCCRREKATSLPWQARAMTVKPNLIPCQHFPTPVQYNSPLWMYKRACLRGNNLDDGYEYVFNDGRNTPDAKCGPGSDYWCCKRAKQDAIQDCLSKCYPETANSPCDGKGHHSDCKIRVLSNPDRKCNCEWGPEIKHHLESCHVELARSVPVFSPGDGGISCFRIPAIVKSKKGTLLAFAESRYGGCGDGAVHEIAMKRSTDQGETWSDVSYPAGSAEYHVGNPYPIALRSGRVLLIFLNHSLSGPGSEQTGISNGMVYTDDEGLTWSANSDIGPQFGPAQGSSPGPGSGIELDSGRLLVVSHKGPYQRDFVTYSDDGGKTWTTIDQTFEKMDEAVFADLGNDEVILNMRHLGEHDGKAVARSTDGGKTWTNIELDSALYGPICEGSMATIKGRPGKLYFSNPASRTARSHIAVRRSDDGGRTWKKKLVIQEGGSAGYSSLVRDTVGDDDHGGIIYESTRPGGIDFTTFHLDLFAEDDQPFNIGEILVRYEASLKNRTAAPSKAAQVEEVVDTGLRLSTAIGIVGAVGLAAASFLSVAAMWTKAGQSSYLETEQPADTQGLLL